MTVDKFWQEFLEKTNKDKFTKYIESFYFCFTEDVAAELLELVLSGKKTATTSSLLAFEKANEPVPTVGSFSIITDFHGNPHCVIETTSITTLKFSEMTFELCRLEGEDDNLESWQRNHRKFFTEDGKEVGYEFSEDMPVIFEEFKVVYKI